MQELATPKTDVDTIELCDRAVIMIRDYEKKTINNVVIIGKLLSKVKAALNHGTYLTWLQNEVQWEERTARNYVNAAKAFDGKTETVSRLPLAKVYQLATLAEADRDRIVTLITDPANPPMDKINHELEILKVKRRLAEAAAAPKAGNPKSAKSTQRDAANESRRAAERQSHNALRATLANVAKGWVTLMTADQVAEIVTAVTTHGPMEIGMALVDAAKEKLGADTPGHAAPEITSVVSTAQRVIDLDEVEDAAVVSEGPVLHDLDLSQVQTAA